MIDGDAKRKDEFFPDKGIEPQKFAITNEYFQLTKAYRNFGLNRGHMAAAGNYSGNQ